MSLWWSADGCTNRLGHSNGNTNCNLHTVKLRLLLIKFELGLLDLLFFFTPEYDNFVIV